MDHFLLQIYQRWVEKNVFILKLLSAISHQMIALQKLWKMLFISSKKLFSFLRYLNFAFPSFPLFLPVNHCFRGWLKINLKVCDIINCLNKNLVTHFFFDILRRKKGITLKLYPLVRVLNKEHFYWKIMKKICTRGYSQNPFQLW